MLFVIFVFIFALLIVSHADITKQICMYTGL